MTSMSGGDGFLYHRLVSVLAAALGSANTSSSRRGCTAHRYCIRPAAPQRSVRSVSQSRNTGNKLTFAAPQQLQGSSTPEILQCRDDWSGNRQGALLSVGSNLTTRTIHLLRPQPHLQRNAPLLRNPLSGAGIAQYPTEIDLCLASFTGFERGFAHHLPCSNDVAHLQQCRRFCLSTVSTTLHRYYGWIHCWLCASQINCWHFITCRCTTRLFDWSIEYLARPTTYAPILTITKRTRRPSRVLHIPRLPSEYSIKQIHHR